VAVKPALLLLTYFYPPDPQSGSARPYRLAKYLGELGHPVQVLAAGNHLAPAAEGHVHRLRGGAIRGMPRDFASLVERGFRQTLFVHDPGGTWVPRAAAYAARWMQGPVKPVVLSTAPPMCVPVAAWWLKRRYGARWIADFRDPLRDNPFRSSRMAVFFDPLLERAFLGSADAIIANTDTMGDLWRRRYPQWAGKIHVVWNGFDPEERLAARPLPPRDGKVLVHVGEIYGSRDPGLLLESARRLRARAEPEVQSLRIRLVGPLARESPLLSGWQDLVAEGCLELVAPLPRREAQRIMAESDYLLLLDVTTGATGLQVPAKLFEYVRTGRPVVACTTRGSPVDRILAQSGVHYTSLYPDLPAEETDRRLLAFLRESSPQPAPSPWFEANFNARRQAEYVSALASRLAGTAG